MSDTNNGNSSVNPADLSDLVETGRIESKKNMYSIIVNDGYYFDQLINFIKTKILSIMSVVFVTYALRSQQNNEKMHVSIKYIVLSLLCLSIILLISGFFEFLYTVKTYKSKNRNTFDWLDWVITILVSIMYAILCIVVFLFIRYQYKILMKQSFTSKV